MLVCYFDGNFFLDFLANSVNLFLGCIYQIENVSVNINRAVSLKTKSSLLNEPKPNSFCYVVYKKKPTKSDSDFDKKKNGRMLPQLICIAKTLVRSG